MVIRLRKVSWKAFNIPKKNFFFFVLIISIAHLYRCQNSIQTINKIIIFIACGSLNETHINDNKFFRWCWSCGTRMVFLMCGESCSVVFFVYDCSVWITCHILKPRIKNQVILIASRSFKMHYLLMESILTQLATHSSSSACKETYNFDVKTS